LIFFGCFKEEGVGGGGDDANASVFQRLTGRGRRRARAGPLRTCHWPRAARGRGLGGRAAAAAARGSGASGRAEISPRLLPDLSYQRLMVMLMSDGGGGGGDGGGGDVAAGKVLY
jgi:hypothetical protein